MADTYVAWCRYERHDDKPTTIHLCDSDADGAFPVYKAREAEQRVKPKPNFGPTYAAAMYPELVEIVRQHGYALAVHGSLQRDLDLIAIPWVDEPSTPEDVLDAITSVFVMNRVGGVGKKPHGRMAYTLSIGWGECAIDLQFMPALAYRDLCEHGVTEGNWCPRCNADMKEALADPSNQ